MFSLGGLERRLLAKRAMKFPAGRLASLAAVFAAGVSIVRAHPGHDGHELTWDFGHLAQHPVATMACGAVLGIAFFVAIQVRRHRAELRVQRVNRRRDTR